MKQQEGKSIDQIEDVVRDIMDIYQTRLLQLDRHVYNWTLQYNSDVFSVVLEAPDYWWYGENGRRAGKMPPIDAILKWIRVKHIVPRPLKGKLPTQDQLAFLIARKIGRYGTIGKHPWKNALADAENLGKLDELYNAVFNFMTNSLDEELEKINK